MSGPIVTSALKNRFDAIRRAELQRLEKKLRGLTADDRESIESITADVILAIARVPEDAIDSAPQPTLDAFVQLFALEEAR